MARIPDSIKHKFQRIIEESKGDARFKQFLVNGNDENYKWAYAFAYERAYGKAPQNIDMEFNDVTNRPTREELEQAQRTIKEIATSAIDIGSGTKLDSGE